MDSDFASALADWNAFFAAVAGVAATLVGLLFVALSLNPHIMGDEGPTGLRVWSTQTFQSFFGVLILGLAGLVPGDAGQTLAITLAIVGAQGLIRVVTDFIRVRGDRTPDWGSWAALGRFASPALAYLGSLWMGWEVWWEDVDSLGWIVAIVFLLMIGALASCWELMKAVGNLDREGPPTAPGN